MAHSVELLNRQRKFEVDAPLRDMILKCARACLAEQKFPYKAQLSIQLVSNRVMAQYNRQFMGKSGPTDVLSFPLLYFNEDGSPIVEEGDLMHEADELPLGDLILSLERAQSQAEEYGHSFTREVGYLTVHGMFHLLGFDHMDEAEKALMRQKEETVLKRLRLTRGSGG